MTNYFYIGAILVLFNIVVTIATPAGYLVGAYCDAMDTALNAGRCVDNGYYTPPPPPPPPQLPKTGGIAFAFEGPGGDWIEFHIHAEPNGDTQQPSLGNYHFAKDNTNPANDIDFVNIYPLTTKKSSLTRLDQWGTKVANGGKFISMYGTGIRCLFHDGMARKENIRELLRHASGESIGFRHSDVYREAKAGKVIAENRHWFDGSREMSITYLLSIPSVAPGYANAFQEEQALPRADKRRVDIFSEKSSYWVRRVPTQADNDFDAWADADAAAGAHSVHYGDFDAMYSYDIENGNDVAMGYLGGYGVREPSNGVSGIVVLVLMLSGMFMICLCVWSIVCCFGALINLASEAKSKYHLAIDHDEIV